MKSKDGDNKYIVSGGLVAFGISMTVLLILDYLFPPDLGADLTLRLFGGLIIYIIAGAAAGFLVAYKIGGNHLINALKTGFFGFVVNIVIMLFLQTLYGIVWIFLGYSLGGMIGGIIAKILFDREKAVKPS